MFGSILAMSKDDVIFSVALSVVVLIMFGFCYHRIFAVTFDESFSKATGVKSWNVQYTYFYFYGGNCCTWNKNDGSNVDFKSYYFSGAYFNESF